MSMRRHHVRGVKHALIAALLTALPLAGCAMSDDKLATMLVAPGKFALYTCPELVQKAKELGARQRELEGLMAKAGDGASGKVVSTLAYRPDYLSARGEMHDVREAATGKGCIGDVDAAAAGTATGAATSAAPAPPKRATIQR